MIELPMKDHQTIGEVLSWRAVTQPQKIAYRFLLDGEKKEEVLTYHQLEEKSRWIAHKIENSLSTRRNEKGEKLLGLLLYPASLEFICAFFGCLHANVIAVPSSLPSGIRGKSRVENIIKTAHIDFVLTDSMTFSSLQKSHINWVDVEWIITDQCDSSSLLPLSTHYQAAIKSDIAFIQYTSGSTHFPKGVVITHGNLISNEAMIKEAFGHNDQTVFVGWLPFFHDMGLIGNILQPMYLGIEATLMSPLSFLQKPIRWLEAISRYHATTSGAPNFAYDLCVEKAQVREEIDLSSWKVAFSGSETVHSATLMRFARAFSPFGFSSKSFYPCYGLAEATLFVSGKDSNASPYIKNIDRDVLEKEGKIEAASTSTEKISSCVSVGHSWKDQRILIVDPLNRHPLPINVQGEICLQGSNIAKGYWQDETATEETFRLQIDHQPGFFLKTGDLGFIDENGLLYITSRLKDLLIIRGRNIIPQDIEVSILDCNPIFNINGCAAFSITDHDEEHLIVVIEIKREYLKNFTDALIEPVKTVLAREHGVESKEIIFVKPNTIPKTSSGKVQRNYCKKLFLTHQLDLAIPNCCVN